ncbi:MAG TPA: GNAT family N-acetyltransferase [Candidatus Binataceae bacterium]|jgi:GNAT superfamily N-acetyltransferase|nr:GNAT family N-acetyltransferase [Candidatus Binataceae bacterium]
MTTDSSRSFPRARVKKVRERAAPDAISLAQTHNAARIRPLLEAAGFLTVGLDHPGICVIAATRNAEVIGVVAVETIVDCALMRSLFVTPSMRRRGIGTRLVAAARAAAVTRGARTLYTLADAAAAPFLARCGFGAADYRAALDELSGCPLADYLQTHRGPALAWKLDVSADGIINR